MENNNEKQTIYSIGGNGLIGSRISELLSNSYTIYNEGPSTNVDITNPQTLNAISNPDTKGTVLLLAAKADVDGCEADKELGENGDAWKINVEGCRNIVDACKKGNKKLIYISTDFIFSGNDTPREGYTEESTPGPINWYGQTKYEAEKIVQNAGIAFLIIRPSYPYRTAFADKKDFLHAILQRLQNGQKVTAVEDHIMTPTFVDDIAHALDLLIQKEATGIFHVVGSDSLTPFDAAVAIAQTFGGDQMLIEKTKRVDYFAGKALRPFNLTINNAKIEKLGLKMHSFHDGLEQVKSQEINI